MDTSAARAAHRTIARIGATVTVGLIATAALTIGHGSPGPDAESVPLTQPTPVVTPVLTPVVTIPRPVILLYGDSLAWEAQDHFVGAFAGRPGVRVVPQTFPGTAICDFLDSMRRDALRLQPGAVVVEFSGNAFTSCMKDAAGQPLSGQAYEDRYRADAEAVVGIFGPIGAHVWFAGAPIPRPDGGRHFNGGRLNAMYREIASERPGVVEFTDAGAAVLDQGRWTATLPCRADEPCRGGTDAAGRPVNGVRAPDGDHFCPASDAAKARVGGACPVWSSGAFRYGRAMAAPVLAALESRAA